MLSWKTWQTPPLLLQVLNMMASNFTPLTTDFRDGNACIKRSWSFCIFVARIMSRKATGVCENHCKNPTAVNVGGRRDMCAWSWSLECQIKVSNYSADEVTSKVHAYANLGEKQNANYVSISSLREFVRMRGPAWRAGEGFGHTERAGAPGTGYGPRWAWPQAVRVVLQLATARWERWGGAWDGNKALLAWVGPPKWTEPGIWGLGYPKIVICLPLVLGEMS